MQQRMLDLFVYFVNERDRVRINKSMGLPQGEWTKDPILQRHHFCNVRREDDRGTQELRELGVQQPVGYLPKFYTLARLLNLPESVAVYLDDGVAGLKARRAEGSRVFNTAYTVATCGAKVDKIDYVVGVAELVGDIDVPRTSCRSAFNALRSVPGLGSFLAGQVVADLKNDRYLHATPDWHTFAVMGPGSKKGLDIITGESTTEKTFLDSLHELKGATAGKITELHMQDLQNCLCEFSKYVRYLNNTGGRIRNYHYRGDK